MTWREGLHIKAKNKRELMAAYLAGWIEISPSQTRPGEYLLQWVGTAVC